MYNTEGAQVIQCDPQVSKSNTLTSKRALMSAPPPYNIDVVQSGIWPSEDDDNCKFVSIFSKSEFTI